MLCPAKIIIDGGRQPIPKGESQQFLREIVPNEFCRRIMNRYCSHTKLLCITPAERPNLVGNGVDPDEQPGLLDQPGQAWAFEQLRKIPLESTPDPVAVNRDGATFAVTKGPLLSVLS